ncbi:MerR family transcriptional regulator [candidate division KSB1 bacterium]|nr:MAG: MerR family transcriptional regulator [candidate division KSB1 bacterium]
MKKLYYSISEVSRITGLKQHVLRYWETEFPGLKPTKNRAGNRIYRERDIKYLRRIKDLLYNQKYTIEGARRKLKEEEELDKKKGNIKEKIKEIRKELKDVLDILS